MTSRFRRLLPVALAAAAPLLFLVLAGCDDSDEFSVTRNIEAYVAGVYRNNDTNANNGFLVSYNTGSPVEQFDLRQYGTELQAIDNHGIIFEGSLGDFVTDNTVAFELSGKTSLGNPAVVSGTIEISSGIGRMRGTWIEDTLTATVYGEATGPTVKSNVTQQVAAPTFSVSSTTFTNSITVTISTTTSGATIRYTTDGADPTSSSTAYSAALTFTSTTTLRAKGFLTGWADSDTTSATYTKQ